MPRATAPRARPRALAGLARTRDIAVASIAAADRMIELRYVVAVCALQVQSRDTRARAAVAHEVATEAAMVPAAHHGEIPVALLARPPRVVFNPAHGSTRLQDRHRALLIVNVARESYLTHLFRSCLVPLRKAGGSESGRLGKTHRVASAQA